MAKTTITVQEDTLERFKALKAELDAVQDAPDHTADTFLKRLLDTWEKVDDVGYGDTDDVQLGDGYEEIAAKIGDAMDVDTLSYDDIKAACEAAIREEVPER